MSVHRLLGCNVYISEGRNVQLIRRLEATCRQHPATVVLAHTFIDEPYNRTGFTLAANSIPELAATIHAVAQQALQCINLTTHIAQHPRLGVLDHVSLHPLGPEATLSLAAQAAVAIGQQLSQQPLQLPVYYYGAAHPAGRRLAEIRRQLGYFKPNSSENWHGSIQQLQLSGFPPDAGPLAATAAAAGVVTVGAVPWVTNYNVPLHTDDVAAARAVARAVSTKGGGLPGVEAMALPHGPGVIEIATNLIAYDWRSNAAAPGDPCGTTPQQASSAAAAAPSSQDNSAGSSHHHFQESAMHSHSSSSGGSGQSDSQPGSWSQSRGAGPEDVAAAVAQEARRHGLPPPGLGYVTNKTPPELIAYAAETLQQS